MPAIINCSKCHRDVYMRPDSIKKNFTKFRVSSILDLNKVYLCIKCKERKHNFTKRFWDVKNNHLLLRTALFREMIADIQKEVDTLTEKGLTKENQVIFLENVKFILKNKHINEYEYIIKDNKLKGIMLKNVSIFGNIPVKLKS